MEINKDAHIMRMLKKVTPVNNVWAAVWERHFDRRTYFRTGSTADYQWTVGGMGLEKDADRHDTIRLT